MLNYIWLGLVLVAVLVGGFTGRIKELVESTVKSAELAVTIAIGLIGVMSLWLGVMRLAEKAGLVQALARALRPALRRLFPEVPERHPAMGAMVMNFAANMLGLTNAATPLGLRAMRDLESLNPRPGTATNAMCTFLAINTSSIQLVPMTAVAILAAEGSKNPSAIIGTALLATVCSTIVGISAVKLLEKLPRFRLSEPVEPAEGRASARTGGTEASTLMEPTASVAPLTGWGRVALVAFVGCFAWFFATLVFPDLAGRPAAAAAPGETALVRSVNAISLLAIPFLVCFFPLYAALRHIAVFEEFVEGAKEGFQVAVRIIPFLVAMLVAIGMFRAAGAVDMLTRGLQPVLDLIHFPGELLPLSLMRPLSGSASLALFTELVKQHGPDSMVARIAGTLFGSTETTFYVIAVYFGSVNIQRTRHAVPAGLLADLAGIIAAVIICRMVFA